jgi:glycosyltransferase involved in cell wall biosynthesis
MEQTFALLITYYNEKELFTACMNSIATQTVAPDELLIYDDCSPYPAKDYIPENFTIPYRIIRGAKNSGSPAYGRNVLLKECTADYVHFHDADDLVAPDAIAKIKYIITNNTVDLLINNVELYINEQFITKNFMELEKIQHMGLVDFSIIYFLGTIAVTIKRELTTLTHGFIDNTLLVCAEDYEYNIRMAYHAKSWLVIDEPLFIYKQRNQSRNINEDLSYASYWVFKALEVTAQYLPPIYHQTIANRLNLVGCILFTSQKLVEAKKCFSFAQKLHKNSFAYLPKTYRHLGSLIGMYNTVVLTKTYRKLLPNRFRAFLNSLNK